MTNTYRPTPGQSAVPTITDAVLWTRLLDMVAAWESGGQRGRSPIGDSHQGDALIINNDSSAQIARGELRQLNVLSNQDSNGVAASDDFIYITATSPVFTVEDPVWHSEIDQVVLFHKPIPPGALGTARSPRIVAAPITGTPAQTDRWLMIDPVTPTRLKACKTSGIYRMLGWLRSDNEPVAVVDTFQSQNWWKYELTQDSQAPSDTTAKLLDLEGTEYAASINLSDPDGFMDDQVTGDQGWCVHIGNKFYAIQAVC